MKRRSNLSGILVNITAQLREINNDLQKIKDVSGYVYPSALDSYYKEVNRLIDRSLHIINNISTGGQET